MEKFDQRSRIFVAGHRGLVGSAVVRRLKAGGFSDVVTQSRADLDLRNAAQVEDFFASSAIDVVILAAAKVGGIHANDAFGGDFIRDNLQIQVNSIDAAYRHGVKKLIFLGSTCIYPRDCSQPMREDMLLSGPLEPTNQPYAIAKIAGIEMCNAYRRQYGFNAISLMPTNLYGPEDNFHPENSHVLPALMRRLYEAREAGMPTATIWGTGKVRREFLHVDDLADAIVFLMQNYDGGELVNVGVGEDISIAELASLIAETVGFEGELVFDVTRPDGTPRKLVDVGRLTALGWRARTPLRQGIEQTFEWYRAHRGQVRAV